ncbi:class I SAM-dependent methyltransferase [Rubellicoccus peritrichatus]|uniref:Class I SAM-dependent methyltransferase n=1 Tax=Rubellicoccus peritrichatus TaxID=3080537 RepID=A0AAQ3QVI3_9BACT|nr:class I SAM-dependent methyltransferase [Puniceicoccus sp. CR14]WOO41643.1 class I SAM-dependent methyltransferase [Puniceicoccus sp. CR14]
MNSINTKTVDEGQAVYSNKVLSIYDLWVLGISNSFIWKCSTKLLRSEFFEFATENHLDVGVGTGYYLEKCLIYEKCRIGLIDLNANSLQAAASRIHQRKPEIYQANVLDKLNLVCDRFDSISMNYLLHCLPGTIKEKSVVFDNLIPYLNKNGVVFGSTLLGTGIEKSGMASWLMAFYNRKGIFHNSQDSLDDLTSALNNHFTKVEVKVVGCAAVFSGQLG